MAGASVPPEAKDSDIRVSGKSVLGPGGVPFGTLHKLGMFNVGTTSIGQFVEANPALFGHLSPSLTRIMRAVSVNEGRLEAINTWDGAFLSYGVYQWTAGADNGNGELANVLDCLRSASLDAFQEYFGHHGIDVAIGPPKAGVLRKGFIVLNGVRLDEPKKKEELRRPIWAYRFWRAGHDPDVRKCQIEQAAARIGTFYKQPSAMLGGKAVGDFVKSEYGVALLLDQHVNRPGHVPKTLADAVKSFVASTGRSDPGSWTSADERAVLERYLTARAGTSMTDSTKRAERVGEAVKGGQLSADRGSFVV
jgi:hypothetical protein